MIERDLTFYSAGLKLAATLYAPDGAKHLPTETADDLLTYKPELDVHRISPRPLFVIGAELDYIVNVEESHRLYEKALDPKRLHILSGMSHTEPYSKGLDEVVRLSSQSSGRQTRRSRRTPT